MYPGGRGAADVTRTIYGVHPLPQRRLRPGQPKTLIERTEVFLMPREPREVLILNFSEDDRGDQITGANEARAPLPAIV